MEFFEILQKRRSIRKFEDKPVEPEKVERLLQAAFLSPSSHNHRPWHFIIVDDRELLNKLSKSKDGAQPLRNAPLAIVVAADETKSDVWIEDSSIAAEHIQLAAVDLGLGSCWIQIRNRYFDENTTAEQYIQQLLEIPKNYRITCIIGVGYPLRRKPEKQPVIEFDKVSWNKFANFGKKL